MVVKCTIIGSLRLWSSELDQQQVLLHVTGVTPAVSRSVRNLPPPPLPSSSNAYVQATPVVGSVNFRTLNSRTAFFNWSYCALCVLSDTRVLRCMMFIFCVELFWA